MTYQPLERAGLIEPYEFAEEFVALLADLI